MKTFWSTSNRPQSEIQAIAKKQAEKFGVPFTFYPAHDGWAIRPTFDATTVASDNGLLKVLAVLVTFDSKSFTMIAHETGLDIRCVVAVAKYINTGINRENHPSLQRVSVDIGRSGKPVGMHNIKRG